MENEYTLYLDESKTVDDVFVIGGFAVHISEEENLNRMFRELKDSVFKKTNSKAQPVFHATDYIKRYPNAFSELIDIVRKVKGTVFATVIKLDELSELYGKYNEKDVHEYCFVDDPFNIGLQNIIENYTHFLYYNQAFGKTIYESRNSIDQNWLNSPDFLLKRDYLKVVANNRGLGYINSEAVKLCNTNFSVKKKKEDLPGLQIADNIAYTIARAMSPTPKELDVINEMFDQIFYLAYNGRHDFMEKDLRHFYGIRVLPEMFRRVNIEKMKVKKK